VEVCPDRPRQLVDRSAAGREIRHHLGSDLGGIGRHALRRHAVVAREHEDVDPIEAGHASSLPPGEPHDDVFEPPQAAGRLGELALALGRDRRRLEISRRQVETRRPQPVERRKERRLDRCARLPHSGAWTLLLL
jgi:hypothetical protein